MSRRIDAPVGDRSDWIPQWPDVEPYFIPFGKGALTRKGTSATVVSYGRQLPICVQVANELFASGLGDVEVLDLRSIFPYDWSLISQSVAKTGRVILVNEDTEVTNFGEHLYRRIVEEFFYDLLAPPVLLAGKHVPGIGLNQEYEMNTVPQAREIREALVKLLEVQP